MEDFCQVGGVSVVVWESILSLPSPHLREHWQILSITENLARWYKILGDIILT